jgi:predicted transcriptional regulator
MERLTPAEELVMLKLWKLEKAAVKDIQELFENPKPAYNTTSTIVRILERKKFIKHQSIGRGYLYSPKILDFVDLLIDVLFQKNLSHQF